MVNSQYVAAIIPAAGLSSRMGAGINKQFLNLNGEPVIIHTLRLFEECNLVNAIYPVVRESDIGQLDALLKEYNFRKIRKIVAGGNERQDSVHNGLLALELPVDLVVIHDGARPLLTEEMLKLSISEGMTSGAVGVGVPVKDTIKIVDKDNFIIQTPDRKTVWAIHTPQVFWYNIIRSAYDTAMENGYTGTDDCTLVERTGYPVKMLKGNYENIKITTPEDVIIAEQIKAQRLP